MQKRKKVYLLLLLLTGIFLLASCSTKEEEKEKIQVPVEVYQAAQGQIVREITVGGLLEAEVSAMVIPEIAGAQEVISIPVKVGDRVRKGAILGYLDSEASLLAYEIAEATYLDAEKNLERNRALYEAGAMSSSQFEQLETGYLQAKNAWELRKIELAGYTVTSPIDGVISAINASVGNFTSAQSPFAVVSKTEKLLLKTNINEKEVKNLKAGQEIDLEVPGILDHTFTGKIKSVAPAMDLQTRSFPLEIEVDNKELLIQAGTFAKAKVEVERKDEVLIIPSQAIIIRGNEARVYIIEENQAQPVTIETGISNNVMTEVISGLSLGDQIITKGNDNVIVGDLVRIVGEDAAQ